MTPKDLLATASQMAWSLYINGYISDDHLSPINMGIAAGEAALKQLEDLPVRVFHLLRDVDKGGVSGTGLVAIVVAFEDGPVVIRWLKNENQEASFSIRVSLDDAIRVHGHGGLTRFAEVGVIP